MTLDGTLKHKWLLQVASKLFAKKKWFDTFEAIEVSEFIGKFKITIRVMRIQE